MCNGSVNPAPFDRHRAKVAADWIDYNGHMNVAYYVLAFDHATDTFFDHLDVGPRYVKEQNGSLFVLGMNIDYQREVFEGDPLRITTQLLDFDHKRVHFFHQMYHAEEGFLVATNELLAMHVDMTTRRSASLPAATQETLEAMLQCHRQLPTPEGAFRTLGIRRQ